jgi:hypothetical protein
MSPSHSLTLRCLFALTVGIVSLPAVGGIRATAQPRAAKEPADATVPIPESIELEHDAIQSALAEATRAPGKVGAAAEELAVVLHPHFVREEQIALPPLSLLASLAAGADVSSAVTATVLEMTDALRAELPRMLEEHTRIRAAVDELRRAARAERAAKFEELADHLTLHARTEEEVLYPAAVLVGDLLRVRGGDQPGER